MLYMPLEQGQGLVEYALLLVFVSIAVIIILAVLGGSVGNVYSNLISRL
jgi:pilus assembly protein Flp/PilA